MANGYDDVQFLGEVPDLELQEIGILNAADRAKVNIIIRCLALNTETFASLITLNQRRVLAFTV